MWRRFRKWAGFPVWEDVPCCKTCDSKLTIGEFPAYEWECPVDSRHQT